MRNHSFICKLARCADEWRESEREREREREMEWKRWCESEKKREIEKAGDRERERGKKNPVNHYENCVNLKRYFILPVKYEIRTFSAANKNIEFFLAKKHANHVTQYSSNFLWNSRYFSFELFYFHHAHFFLHFSIRTKMLKLN